MKKLCLLLAVVILASVSAPVQAQDRQLLRIVVPFNFMVENRSVPAGSYSLYLLNPFNLVRIQSDRGEVVVILHVIPAQNPSASTRSELVFNRIDGEYFLAEVREQGNDIQRNFLMGTRARELAKNYTPQQIATVLVHGR